MESLKFRYPFDLSGNPLLRKKRLLLQKGTTLLHNLEEDLISKMFQVKF